MYIYIYVYIHIYIYISVHDVYGLVGTQPGCTLCMITNALTSRQRAGGALRSRLSGRAYSG